VSTVRYELGFYIPEESIIRSYHRETLKSNIIIGFCWDSTCITQLLQLLILIFRDDDDDNIMYIVRYGLTFCFLK
jgi:hypothetical protein